MEIRLDETITLHWFWNVVAEDDDNGRLILLSLS